MYSRFRIKIKIFYLLILFVLLSNLARANDSDDPCLIQRPAADGVGIELNQLPFVLRAQLLSYYTSCNNKPVKFTELSEATSEKGAGILKDSSQQGRYDLSAIRVLSLIHI